MTSILIARLPPHFKSSKAIEFMQENGFFYRITSNSPLANLLTSSGGVEDRLAQIMGLCEEFKPGKEEIQIVKELIKKEIDDNHQEPEDFIVQLGNKEKQPVEPENNALEPAEVKEEVDSDGMEGVLEAATEETAQENAAPIIQPPITDSPVIQTLPTAVHSKNSEEVALNLSGQQSSVMEAIYDEAVDDIPDSIGADDSTMSIHPLQNDGHLGLDASLEEEKDGSDEEKVQPVVVPSTVAEQGVQDVQAKALLEEAQLRADEPHFLGEKEEDEQRMKSVDDREMALDDLLQPIGAGDSMMSFDPFHNGNSYFFDAALEEDIPEQETVQATNSTEPVVKEKTDISESVLETPTVADQTAESVEASADSTMSLKTIGQAEIEEVDDEDEEEEELVEEQECDDEEKDCDQEEDEDSTEDDEENASSDDDVREEIKKTKGRPSGSQGRFLFTCPCRNCPSSYKTFKKLEEHMEIHTGKQEFFCDVCKKSFSSKDDAKVHIQEREKKECCECGKKFQDLVRHLRCHTGEKPFECITCGQRFTREGHMKSHMWTHTGEKRFSCGICKKRFVWGQSLKVHERTHTGEKPYECNHCDYRSANASNLRIHSRIHIGEKLFSCGHCEKRFSQKSTLKRHELTHTGEKPYECSHCGKGFSDRSYLKQHINIHAGQKPYPCDKCDKKFSRSDNLKRLMKKIHQS